jgi:hypothetical protein
MPGEGSAADVATKAASAVKEYRRSGRYTFRPAKSAAEQRLRDDMRAHMAEVVKRL